MLFGIQKPDFQKPYQAVVKSLLLLLPLPFFHQGLTPCLEAS
jgi:hypothetical protein